MLLCRCHMQFTDVGTIQLGCAALLDRSKCITTGLQSLLEVEGGGDTEGVDHAGSSSASALRACVLWAQGTSWDGRWAIAVSADDAHQSSGAAVALVGPSAPLAMRDMFRNPGYFFGS